MQRFNCECAQEIAEILIILCRIGSYTMTNIAFCIDYRYNNAHPPDL